MNCYPWVKFSVIVSTWFAAILFTASPLVAAYSSYELGQSGFGVHLDSFQAEELVEQVRYADEHEVKVFRLPLAWETVQYNHQAPLEYSWSINDGKVAAIENDSAILGILGPNLDWSGQLPCHYDPQGRCTNPTYDLPDLNLGLRSSPNGSAMWSRWEWYVYQTVTRYGRNGQNKVHAWEVLNEADWDPVRWSSTTASLDEMRIRGRAYGEVLNKTVEVIRAADPAAIIVSAGLADWQVGATTGNSILPSTRAFLEGVSQTAIWEQLDGFGVHPYRAGVDEVSSYLTNLKLALPAEAQNLPFWITEFGFTSDSLYRGCGQYCQYNTATEAEAMSKLLSNLKANPNIFSAFWFQLAARGENDTASNLPYSLYKEEGGSNIESPRTVLFWQEVLALQANACLGADANRDSIVNLLDYALLTENFNRSRPIPRTVDQNSDGRVNLLDYALLTNDFFKRKSCQR